MWRRRLVVFSFAVVLASPSMPHQRPAYTTAAGIDADGNIYVASDDGQAIKMATVQHCIEAKFADDKQTVGCSVARGTTSEQAMQSIRLEIYLRNGKLKVIETETSMDWHFWHDGQQVSVCRRSVGGQKLYALYDAASAQLVQELAVPADESSLPEWAKSPEQVQDESVPVGKEYSEERTNWIAKVLRQITRIQPGMKRKDLLSIFTTEGGLSSRLQRTYVYSECPYIKVSIRFKAANKEGNAAEEQPDDIIQFISQPYLAGSIAD
jgi:hypothetical protein